jgi:hypothetical protein
MLPFYTYLLVAGLPHFALQIPSFPSPRSFVPHCPERHWWLPTDTLPLILRPSRFTEQVILPIKFPQLFADRCRRCRRRCSVSCARSTLSRLPILSFSILSCRFRLRHPSSHHQHTHMQSGTIRNSPHRFIFRPHRVISSSNRRKPFSSSQAPLQPVSTFQSATKK